MQANNAPAAFSFVPQQSGKDVAKTNRKFINSHLSQIAARKRTRGATGRSQRKVVLPVTQSELPKVAIERLKSFSGEYRAWSDEVLPNQAETFRDGDEDRAIVLLVSGGVVSRAKPSLNFINTVLGTGGIDPFHSTLIPIDTTVHKLLGFEKEVFFPWSAGIEEGADKDGAFRNKFAQIIPEAFDDLCTGYANLARLAAMTATVTFDPRMAAVAIRYKGLAYQYMRKSIAAHAENDKANELAMVQMFSLMSMEVADGKCESSAIHSKALLRMMTVDRDTRKATHIKPSKLLNAVLWHECIRGGNTLRQYVFDPSQLIDHAPVLDTLATAKQKLFSLGYWPHQPTDEDDGFHHFILPPHLISLVIEIRFLTDMNAALTYVPQFIDDDLMSAYGHRASYLCSKLLGVAQAAAQFISNSNNQCQRQRQHPCSQPPKVEQQQQQSDEYRYEYETPQFPPYNNHQETSTIFSNSPNLTVSQAHTNRATALAAQFALRVVTSHEAVDLPPASATSVAAQLFAVYGTQRRVLGELKVAWEGRFAGNEGVGWDGNGEGGERGLWLWILWIGTLAERAELWLRARSSHGGFGGGEQARDVVEGWFNAAFVRQALGMGLREWGNVKEVLRKYIYIERNTWRSRETFEEGVRSRGVVRDGLKGNQKGQM